MLLFFCCAEHITEQTPNSSGDSRLTSPPGTHFSAKSTEVMRSKCLAQQHNLLMQLGFDSAIAVSRNPHDSPIAVSRNPHDSPIAVSRNPHDSPIAVSRNPHAKMKPICSKDSESYRKK